MVNCCANTEGFFGIEQDQVHGHQFVFKIFDIAKATSAHGRNSKTAIKLAVGFLQFCGPRDLRILVVQLGASAALSNPYLSISRGPLHRIHPTTAKKYLNTKIGILEILEMHQKQVLHGEQY